MARRRGVLGWALSAVATAAFWWAVAGASDRTAGVVLAGGWSLTLLPVHAARFRRRSSRRAGPAPDAPSADAPSV